MINTLNQQEPYYIKPRKDFLSACKKHDLIKLSFIIKENSYSTHNSSINEEQIDQALEIVSSSKKVTKFPIIEYLKTIKIQKNFIEACENHDLELVKRLLHDSTISMHIHYSQIKHGFEKCYGYDNPLVNKDTRFTNDMYLYLADLLNNYSKTFFESIRNNDFQYFQDHLPNFVERNSETENQRYDLSVYLQKLLNTACKEGKEGKVDFINFLHTADNLTLRPLLEFTAPNKPEFNAFHIACENEQLASLEYLINHSTRKPSERTIYSNINTSKYSKEVQDHLSEHTNFCIDTDSFFSKMNGILMDDFEVISKQIIEFSKNPDFIRFSKDSIVLLTDLFIESCSKGNFRMVEFLTTSPLLPLHANFNFENIHKTDTGFNNACKNGHLDIVKFLSYLSNGIEYSIIATNALKSACQTGQIDIIEYLTDKYLPFAYFLANTLLSVACQYGQLDTIKFLNEKSTHFKEHLNIYNYEYNILSDTILSKQDPKMIIKILDYIFIELFPQPMNKQYSKIDYNTVLDNALKTEDLTIIDFLLSNKTFKQHFSTDGHEKKIIEILCTNNKKNNNIELLEYFLCEYKLKNTPDVIEYCKVIKNKFTKNPLLPELINLNEFANYTEKLFAVIELNEKMKNIPVSTHIINKKSKI